jgi:hypothetical protein
VACSTDKNCEEQAPGASCNKETGRCEKLKGGPTSYAGPISSTTSSAGSNDLACVINCVSKKKCNSFLCPAPQSTTMVMGCVKGCIRKDKGEPLHQTKSMVETNVPKIKYYMCVETGEIVRSV